MVVRSHARPARSFGTAGGCREGACQLWPAGHSLANAGIQSFKPILEWEDADWHDQIDVNLTGTCNAIRAVAPHLVANGGGRIIVTSSTQGRHGTEILVPLIRRPNGASSA